MILNRDLCPVPPQDRWQAKWIWLPSNEDYPARNSFAFFRRRFCARGTIRLSIAADTRYELYLDGHRVGRGTAACDVRYKTFDSYRFELPDAEHVVGVIVHHVGEISAACMKSRPGLLVEIDLLDGKRIVSDNTWRSCAGTAFEQNLPCLMSHFGFYHVCDYRLMPNGWTDLDFDDQDWFQSEIIGEAGCPPWLNLIPRDIPHLIASSVEPARILCKGEYQEIGSCDSNSSVADQMKNRIRTIHPRDSLLFPFDLGKGTNHEFAVIDFGREVTGHLSIQVDEATDGQQVDIAYDERLDASGLPDPRRTYAHFADRFFLSEYTKRIEVFDARGFRYLSIDTPSTAGGLLIRGIELEERTYPVDRPCAFDCSDPDLSRLFEIAQQTNRLCMLDTYVDCPSRERVLWMDMYLQGLISAYALGDTQLWRHCIYLFAQNTYEHESLAGAIKGFVPTDRMCIDQVYMMHFVTAVKDYALFSGDLETASKLWTTVTRQLDLLWELCDARGLLTARRPDFGVTDWGMTSFLDWSAMDHSGVSAATNAFHLLALQDAIELARCIDRESQAERFTQRIDTIRGTFRNLFWSEEHQLFIDSFHARQQKPVQSQLTNVLAVLASLVDGEEANEIMNRICNPGNLMERTGGDYRLSPDFRCQVGGIVQIGTPFRGYLMLEALWKLERDKDALHYLTQNWLPIAPNGTFMEHFVEDTNTSYCHAWGGAPGIVLPRYILGVRPVEPGWTAVEICPRPAYLSWARGVIETPLGRLGIEWESAEDAILLRVNSPPGMRILYSESTTGEVRKKIVVEQSGKTQFAERKD